MSSTGGRPQVSRQIREGSRFNLFTWFFRDRGCFFFFFLALMFKTAWCIIYYHQIFRGSLNRMNSHLYWVICRHEISLPISFCTMNAIMLILETTMHTFELLTIRIFWGYEKIDQKYCSWCADRANCEPWKITMHYPLYDEDPLKLKNKYLRRITGNAKSNFEGKP